MVGSERESYWRGHVERFESSGLSQRAYCDRHSISMSSLHRWRGILAEQRRSRSVEIVPLGNLLSRPQVATTLGRAALTLVAGRYRVEVSDGFSAATLGAVLDLLEERGA